MEKGIAFFDFDGTITTKDTMIELIKFYKGKAAFYLGFAVLSPILVAYKTRLIPNWKAKEKVLSYFFKGIPAGKFQEVCDAFAEEIIPELVRPKALAAIKDFRKNGVRVLVVTASAENWVGKWCRQNGLECLATQLEVKEDRISGKLLGPNCHGMEKVRRIKQHLTLDDYQEVHAFGDTKGDLEMLKLASRRHYKPFCE